MQMITSAKNKGRRFQNRSTVIDQQDGHVPGMRYLKAPLKGGARRLFSLLFYSSTSTLQPIVSATPPYALSRTLHSFFTLSFRPLSFRTLRPPRISSSNVLQTLSLCPFWPCNVGARHSLCSSLNLFFEPRLNLTRT